MKLSKLTWSELEQIRGECNFTDEEVEVFDLLSSGKTIRQIAFKLSLSESTVSRRIREVNLKMARSENYNVPIWEKQCLTIEETAKYSNIGEKKLRELANHPACGFVLRVGNRVLIKRKEFDKFISNESDI